jgi:hypothetical protein
LDHYADGELCFFAEVDLYMTQSIELVVARYKENVGWLRGFDWMNPIVYNKGQRDSANPLPNVGREAHTYLHHIIQNYERLADVTVFLQANPFDHVPDIQKHLLRLERCCSFREFSSELIVEDSRGEPSHPGIPFASMYEDLLGKDVPEVFVCRTAACFAASASTIRSRPWDFYERALELTVSHEFGAHAMERLWQFIFHRTPESEGIVTASDAGFFDNLRFLVASVRQSSDYPIAVYDLGMTEPQREWLSEYGNVSVLAIPGLNKWTAPIRNAAWWQTWLKPLYIVAAPFDRVLWIDADCVVTAELSEAFSALDSGPLLVKDHTPANTQNQRRLYRHLKVPPGSNPDGVSANAGVVGVCRIRDRQLLDTWAWGVQWAAQQPRLRDFVAYADQGLLHWAIARHELNSVVLESKRWNHPCDPSGDWVRKGLTCNDSLLKSITTGHPNASIVHFYGVYKLPSLLMAELCNSLIAKKNCQP